MYKMSEFCLMRTLQEKVLQLFNKNKAAERLLCSVMVIVLHTS